jgi:plastocyanin
MRPSLSLLQLLLVVTLATAAAAAAKEHPEAPRPAHDAGVPAPLWLGEQLPLPLAVRTPEDLAFKAAAERQYLRFNLLAVGKQAWDRGDWEGAASRWEALLREETLPADLGTLLRPWAKAARERALGAPATSPLGAEPAVTFTPLEPEPPEARRPTSFTVAGVVSGGGSHGPGGAVVMLRRLDGATPRPRATRVRAVVQRDKRFVPHVLAVPLGATVEFRNEDELFHNVFSLSRPNDFDLGLYKGGGAREQTFSTAGPVHLLCNIHASMNGWIYVVDSPYFAQADGAGRFAIRNVPEGAWHVEVWHEWSSKAVGKDLKVAAGMAELALAVDGDRQAPAFVPDKSGKPRQPQLGY